MNPPRWTREQFDEQRLVARAAFRMERLGKPLGEWVEEYNKTIEAFNELFERHGLENPLGLDGRAVSQIYAAGLGDSLRYIAGPPISADDLKTLAEVKGFGPKALRAENAAGAERIIATLRAALDPKRFPWVPENRQPTQDEKLTAVMASAALSAYQIMMTRRRTDAKKEQEEAVASFLESIGYRRVPTRSIQAARDFPQPGEFCDEAMVGSRKADLPVGLYDGRIMPIECKVSNSELNSIKRLNNDAAVKAGVWLDEFGSRQVVPTAVLSGVFKVSHLLQSQERGLAIFWAHDLDELRTFVEATKR